MRRLLVVGVLIVPLILAGAAGVGAANEETGAAETVPTFATDVAPILYKSCVSCHRPGQIAPMSLVTYQETRPWAKAIKQKVLAREMPPWFADPAGSVKFRNDRSLTPEQIDTIVSWVDGGAPLGNDADLPPIPQFAEGGWVFGAPDHVFELPIGYNVPAEGEVPTLNLYSAVPAELEGRFVEALEMQPTAREVVHHANVTFVTLAGGVTVVDGKAIAADGRALSSREAEQPRDVWSAEASQFISYVPGRGYEKWRPGVGRRIPSGTHLVWSMHYQPSGRPQTDRSRVGIYFAKTPVTQEVYRTNINQEFPTEPMPARRVIADGQEVPYRNAAGERSEVPPIPPYAENWKMVAIMPVPEDITVWALQPHFHLRGKDVRYVVTYPDGREEAVLTVPKYSFDWQLHYEVDAPLRVPAGSTIMSIVHFDNSLKNRYNPAPDRPVYWAEQSWDEMYSAKIHFTIDSQELGRKKATDQ